MLKMTTGSFYTDDTYVAHKLDSLSFAKCALTWKEGLLFGNVLRSCVKTKLKIHSFKALPLTDLVT
jgi:hypothetical protein